MGRSGPASASTWRAALIGIAALVLIGCGGGGSSSTPSNTVARPSTTTAGGTCPALATLTGPVDDHGTASASGSSVTLRAGDFFFSPTCVVAKPGTTLTVTVTNTGTALHNLSVASLGIDEDVPSGATITVKVKLPSSGSVPFFCKYHVSSGMQGAFSVA